MMCKALAILCHISLVIPKLIQLMSSHTVEELQQRLKFEHKALMKALASIISRDFQLSCLQTKLDHEIVVSNNRKKENEELKARLDDQSRQTP